DLAAAACGRVAVKEAVFPFSRFAGVDALLGPEMKSTGEVMGFDSDFARAFAKSQLAAGVALPMAGAAFVSVRNRDKPGISPIAEELAALGFTIVATGGTGAVLREAGVAFQPVAKITEPGRNIVDMLKDGDIALVLNTTEGAQAIRDSHSLRRAAIEMATPYYTTMAGARAAVQAIRALRVGGLAAAPLQS
ncbi:MAG: carbamoyl phosphate synthase large subunit, partial [Pseudomonadota bacterium]